MKIKINVLLRLIAAQAQLLAESEGLEPTDSEVDEEIEAWRYQADTTPNADPHGSSETDYDSDETRKAVVAVLKRRKAVERALEIAKSKTNGTKRASTKTANAEPAETESASEEIAAVAADPNVADDVVETTETADTVST